MDLKLLILAISLVACIAGAEDEVKKDDEERIIGGRLVSDRTRLPCIVAIQLAQPVQLGKIILETVCGGSIIGKKWVLTAAHCIRGLPVPFMLITAGLIHDTDLMNPNVQQFRIKGVYWHPFYHDYQNDIGLIEIDGEFKFNQYVNAIRVAPANYTPTSSEAIIAGWGRSNDTGEMKPSHQLKETTVKIYPREECRKLGLICNGKHICVGERGNTACQGDSGGPLIQFPYLIGATAHGTTNCEAHAVYTYVPQFHEFMNAVFKGAEERAKSPLRNVYGMPALASDVPGLVSIHSVGSRNPSFRRKRCSGVAIDQQIVLTAAHCLETDETVEGETTFYVIAGSSLAYPDQEFSTQITRVKQIFISPNYKKGSHAADIAVLLVDPLALSSEFDIARFVNRLGFPGDELLAAGYKVTQEQFEPNDVYLENVTTTEKHICSEYYATIIRSDQVCVKSQSIVFCELDTGGPIYIPNAVGELVLEGIRSYRPFPCGLEPQIYTRIADYIDFVVQVMKKLKEAASNQVKLQTPIKEQVKIVGVMPSPVKEQVKVVGVMPNTVKEQVKIVGVIPTPVKEELKIVGVMPAPVKEEVKIVGVMPTPVKEQVKIVGVMPTPVKEQTKTLTVE